MLIIKNNLFFKSPATSFLDFRRHHYLFFTKKVFESTVDLSIFRNRTHSINVKEWKLNQWSMEKLIDWSTESNFIGKDSWIFLSIYIYNIAFGSKQKYWLHLKIWKSVCVQVNYDKIVYYFNIINIKIGKLNTTTHCSAYNWH